MASADPRDTMDSIIDTIKSGNARNSLQAHDALEGIQVTDTSSDHLQNVLRLLDIKAEKLPLENQKYIVQRDGIISFVYLAK